MRLGGVLRIGGAIALLMAGLVHLDLYFSSLCGAGSVPDFGRGILANAELRPESSPSLSPPRREWFVRLAGIALPGGHVRRRSPLPTLGTRFWGSRVTDSIRRRRPRWCWWRKLPRSSCSQRRSYHHLPRRTCSDGVVALGAAGAIVVIAFVGFGIYWSSKYETTAGAGGPTTVAIADFEFTPQVLTVTTGNDGHLDEQRLAPAQRRRHRPVIQQQRPRRRDEWRFRFDRPGEHAYFCGVHPSMTATVTVAP